MGTPCRRRARRGRRLGLQLPTKALGDVAEVRAENVVLWDTLGLLIERPACAELRLKAANTGQRCSLAERLRILWCVEYLGIPSRGIPGSLSGTREPVLVASFSGRRLLASTPGQGRHTERSQICLRLLWLALSAWQRSQTTRQSEQWSKP